MHIRGIGAKHPSDFYVTLDGTDGVGWHCAHTQCVEGDPVQDILDCERKTGKICLYTIVLFPLGKEILLNYHFLINIFIHII